MPERTTRKRPKADPHAIACSIVRKHLEALITAETELTRRDNRLDRAIRAGTTFMSQKQHDALGAKVSAALPSELRADFNRLTDGWGDLMAVCEEAAFLVGLYAGRGGVR